MPDNLKGITIGGRDLATHLFEKEGDDMLNEMIEYKYLKKGSKVRYMDHKEPHGEIKRESQHNLNIINLEANLQKAKTNYERTIVTLITGVPLTSKDLKKKFDASDGSAILNRLRRSPLGAHLMRTEDGKTFIYQMDSDGCNLLPENAINLYKTPISDEVKAHSDLLNGWEDPDAITLPDEQTVTRNTLRIPKDINININVTFSFKWGD